MHRTTKLVSILCLSLATVYLNSAAAAVSTVSSEAEFKTAVQAAKPGDTIQLANGTWEDFEILFVGHGKPNKPITLTAETKGKVIISGALQSSHRWRAPGRIRFGVPKWVYANQHGNLFSANNWRACKSFEGYRSSHRPIQQSGTS